MHKLNLHKKLIIFTLFFTFNSLLALEINSASQAVDISGKQRMYSQQMLKNYAMIGMNNQFGNPSKELKETISSFDKHLKVLHDYTKEETIKSALKEMEFAWKSIETRLSSKASKAEVEVLQKDLEKLLYSSNSVTKLFAKSSNNNAGEVVNIAGRQRMLSQRMASLYMLQVWGIEDPKFKAKLDEALTLFKTSHSTLEKQANNTEAINTKLKSVKRSFMFFEIMSKSSSKYIPSLIYKKSSEILKVMNEVTQEYVQLAKT